MQIFPFFHNSPRLFSEIVIFWLIGFETSCNHCSWLSLVWLHTELDSAQSYYHYLVSNIIGDTTRITVHDEFNTFFLISRLLNYIGKSRFTASNEITSHEKKTSLFTFHGEKIRPFTNYENTLYQPPGSTVGHCCLVTGSRCAKLVEMVGFQSNMVNILLWTIL